MKTQHLMMFLLSGIIYTATSCDAIYFTSPQPFNTKNIYEFPKEYRGYWVNDGDTTIIGKNYFIHKEYKQTHSIAKKEIDTSTIYILKNNKIYIKEKYEDILLTEGFPYQQQNDTIYFKAREIIKLSLGYETFLRKVDQYYILNTSNTTTWWTLYLIKKTLDNTLEISILKEEDLKSNSNFETIYNAEEGLFLDAKWSITELKNLIQKGGFSSMILELDLKDKKPFPK